jgi:ABC-type sugar transport system permease subunit
MAKDYSEPELLAAARSDRSGYLLLAPALLFLFVFFLYPLVWMLSISITEYDPHTATSRTIGFSHYVQALTSPPVWRSLLNTAYYGIVYIPLTLTGAGLLALLLRRRVTGSPALKAIFCSPCAIPVVAAALIWRGAYVGNHGALDRIRHLLGFHESAGWSGWLAESYLVMPCIAVMNVWRDTGFFALILLAALGRIPRQAYEMAAVDGASTGRTLRSIVAPICAGTLSLCLILAVINVLNVFPEIFVMTEDGGPANWSLNLAFLVYRRVYQDPNGWGLAAALSIVLAALTFVIVLIQSRMLNRRLDWS